jgi:adenosylmethionine-8-amino-7-oxononanoate aminotransferase
MGEVLQRRLGELREHPNVGDVRGRGLLAGIEFVEDKQSRKPFDPSARMAENFTQAAQAAGLVVWPNSRYTDQEDGDLVLIGPPFIITESEISELVERFQAALKTATEAIRS